MPEVRGNERAERLAHTVDITTRLQLCRTEAQRGLNDVLEELSEHEQAIMTAPVA